MCQIAFMNAENAMEASMICELRTLVHILVIHAMAAPWGGGGGVGDMSSSSGSY